MSQQLTGKEVWDNTKTLLGTYKIVLGTQGSQILQNDPKKLGSILSSYKFAAKMACKNAKVLELGCGEGLGAAILAEHAITYLGIDPDLSNIQIASRNFPTFTFTHDHYIGKKYGQFEAIISLNPQTDRLFFQTIMDNLAPDGIVIITAQENTAFEMKQLFHQVFTFGKS